MFEILQRFCFNPWKFGKMFVHFQKRGFTLIELLVVMAIISLLVSILLPSLNMARDLAKSAVCMSNQKAIGLANHLYSEDEQGWVCVTSVGKKWTDVYLKQELVVPESLRCPIGEPTTWDPTDVNNTFWTYGIDRYGGKWRLASEGFPAPIDSNAVYWRSVTEDYDISVKLFEQGNLAECPWIMDTVYAMSGVFAQYQAAFYYYWAPLGYIYLRHSNKTNVWFADGHVGSCNDSEIEYYLPGYLYY